MKYKNLLIPHQILSDPISSQIQIFDFQIFSWRTTYQNRVRRLTNVLLPYIKIAIITDGECNITIQNHHYHGKPNEVYLVPPFLLHSAQFLTDSLGTVELLFQVKGFFNQEQYLNLFHSQFQFKNIIDEPFLQLIRALVKKADEHQLGYILGMKSLIGMLSCRMLASIKQNTDLLSHPIENAMIQLAQSFMDALEQTESFLTVHDYCEQLHVSQSYLCRCCLAVMQLSAQEMIIQHRMYRSLQFLSDPSLTMKQIAEKLDYQNPAYFSQQFKKIFYLTPTEYRRYMHPKK